MGFFKKNWKNIVFFVGVALLLIPQTAMPIKVYFNRIIALSPSEVDKTDRLVLNEYNWNLRTLDNKQANFSQSEGNVIVLNLWATWCPPCVAEMPSMQKLYESYADSVDFYFVTSEASKKPLEFIEKNAYSFPVYRMTQAAPEILRSSTIPATYVISKSGVVVIDEKGAANWNSEKVHEVLDGLLTE
ncbi:TlpA family protein disulfide reductase [Ulvibacter sp.]|nr:TlpA family protein disulfide reductase [Ulvibacter sp.]